MSDQPKPRYVGTEYYLAGHWTGDLPAVILSPVLYFQKIQWWRFTSSFNYTLYSLSDFLHYENARNAVSGIQNFLNFSWGNMPSDPPRKLHLHHSHAPPSTPPEKSWSQTKFIYINSRSVNKLSSEPERSW